MPREKFRKQAQAGKERLKCWQCQSDGHISAKCPQKYVDVECLNCREKGHAMRDCPHNIDVGSVKCYQCGEVGHSQRNCTSTSMKTTTQNRFQHAECFICKKMGHLSAQCPENQTKSIYPRGGNCFKCGSVTHLARHCDDSGPNAIGRREEGEEGEAAQDGGVEDVKEAFVSIPAPEEHVAEKKPKKSTTKSQDIAEGDNAVNPKKRKLKQTDGAVVEEVGEKKKEEEKTEVLEEAPIKKTVKMAKKSGKKKGDDELVQL